MRESREFGTRIRALSSVDHVTASAFSSSPCSLYPLSCIASPSLFFPLSAVLLLAPSTRTSQCTGDVTSTGISWTKKSGRHGLPFDPNSSTFPVLPFTISVVLPVIPHPFLFFPSNSPCSFNFFLFACTYALTFKLSLPRDFYAELLGPWIKYLSVGIISCPFQR